MAVNEETVSHVRAMSGNYPAGFVTDIEMDVAPKGLNEDVVHFISEKKGEPAWLLEKRLQAFRHWQGMDEPRWGKLSFPDLDYQDAYYYAAPKSVNDPKLRDVYNTLGVPEEKADAKSGIIVDRVFDSVSVRPGNYERLDELGIIFCPMSEAVRRYPDLVRKYLGSVVPYTDNKHAALNAAVFSDGSFAYIPPGVTSPFDLSTYFRINAGKTGQFERTLVIADKGSKVTYVEGCTAAKRPETQMHMAVVELIAHESAQIDYATAQNWYSGDAQGQGGIYNFVTKRGLCEGDNSRISWLQIETGSAITWKYPGCILKGNGSKGEFYSIAITKGRQQADTGSKMIHLGRNTTSRIVAKTVSADFSNATYRGKVRIGSKADRARNFTQCDSLLIGDKSGAHTIPYIECKNRTATLEHEATTGRIGRDQLFYCMQRGMPEEEAVALIVQGFCAPIIEKMPREFRFEQEKIFQLKLTGGVG